MESHPQKSPFMERVQHVLIVQHYSIRTEKNYLDWIRRFILFHRKRHPQDMAEEVAEFLTHLAIKRRGSPATQDITSHCPAGD